MKTSRPWDRKLWGVEFRDTSHDEPPMLIGTLWDANELHRLDVRKSEPTRPLLFCSRWHARAWCAARNKEYAARHKGDVCRAWRMRPVRVRETVKVIE
jgi:hypothetical protein